MARIPGLYRRGRVWWCKYYVNGRPVRESTKTDKETEAKRFLDGKRGRVANGEPVLPRADRIRHAEAEKDLRAHYEASGSRDLSEYTYRVAHLTAFFDGRRISTLRRMLRLADENCKLMRLPILHLPKEGAPREGVFEREQYDAVRRHLAPDLQVAAAIAFTFGWRTQSEVLTLERGSSTLRRGRCAWTSLAGSSREPLGRKVSMLVECAGGFVWGGI
jgi:hypothetical protein